jgi:8-oxo-dGTP pyrophosphatase MutT (NUDIX family)
VATALLSKVRAELTSQQGQIGDTLKRRLDRRRETKAAIGAPSCGIKALDSPGRQGESLVKALRRELYEETGLHAQIGSLLGVLDRRDKDAARASLLRIVTYSPKQITADLDAVASCPGGGEVVLVCDK